MPTLKDAYRAALDIERAGTAAPALKFALWAAALSGQKKLSWNVAQARVLRPYIDRPLPQDPAEVRGIIACGHSFVSHANAVTVLYVEWLDRTGQLAPYEDMPATDAAWEAWREGLYRLVAGRGLSYKMLSFAALLMWPTHCQLVPVDVWVCRRLARTDAEYHRLCKSLGLYRAIEQQVRAEWEAAGRPYCLGVWHWYRWEAWRSGEAAPCESHAGLSPYAR